MAFNTSRDDASTTALGSIFQFVTTLIVKDFFLTSYLNLPSFTLKPFPLLLSLHALVITPYPALLQPPLGTGRFLLRFLQSLPFSKLNNPNSPSVFTGEALQAPDHFHSSSLDFFPLVLLILGAAELDAALQARYHESKVE